MFSSSRRRRRDERGSVAIQMVFLMPALFLVMFLGVQGALYYHAREVALAAAQEGAREAGSENGTRESGVATANGFLRDADRGLDGHRSALVPAAVEGACPDALPHHSVSLST
ncbi:MAG: TadE family protein, partial [Dietzia sp.]|nr:TadE family protein [Dietzia sp.]